MNVSIRSLGKGIRDDITHRLIPFYLSSITDAFTYRTIPATVYIFFTNLLPAIAFAQDMFDHTANSYGVNEVLLASAMGGIVFGLFSGSPLCIVGVTGPVSIFNYTVYELVVPMGIPYFQFMAWICIWSMIMHILLAVTNSVCAMRYVTRFSCDVFGFFINIVYIQKGIEILSRQFELSGTAGGFASVMVSLVMAIFGCGSVFFGTKTKYLPSPLRTFIKDYGVPLSVVFFSGFIHFGGYLQNVNFAKLATTKAFTPTDLAHRGENWFIYFWRDIKIGHIFLAIPFAFLLTILFYYDHNISSLMCHSSEYQLKKPACFHYDFLLLGITTGVAGILGIPAPNGLIPQAPFHTLSLAVYETDPQTHKSKIVRVVEQRMSNFFQGLMTLGMMSGPLLIVLGEIPQCVLAGLFWVMSIPTLDVLETTNRLRFLFTESENKIIWKGKIIAVLRNLLEDNSIDKPNMATSVSMNEEERYEEGEINSTFPIMPNMFSYLPEIENNLHLPYPASYFLLPKKYFYFHLIFLLLAFTGEFSITCTKGAIGFPGVLMLILILVKLFFKKIFGEWDQWVDGEVVEGPIRKGLMLEVDSVDSLCDNKSAEA